MRSSLTAPARSPQGRGEQGVLGAEMARRLPTAARTLRTACSAVFPGAQRVSGGTWSTRARGAAPPIQHFYKTEIVHSVLGTTELN